MAHHYLLHSTLWGSTCLLIAGLTVCIIDLDEYSWGLYMVLVAIVGLLLCVAFCILGPENTAEPTLAKQLWHRATFRFSGQQRGAIRGNNGETDQIGTDDEETVVEHRRVTQLKETTMDCPDTPSTDTRM